MVAANPMKTDPMTMSVMIWVPSARSVTLPGSPPLAMSSCSKKTVFSPCVPGTSIARPARAMGSSSMKATKPRSAAMTLNWRRMSVDS